MPDVAAVLIQVAVKCINFLVFLVNLSLGLAFQFDHDFLGACDPLLKVGFVLLDTLNLGIVLRILLLQL